jgi:hypothetical protein
MNFKQIFSIAILLTFILSGCRTIFDAEEFETRNTATKWALPLGFGEVKLRELSRVDKNSSLVISPNGDMSYIYKGDLLRRTSETILDSLNTALIPIPLLDTVTSILFNPTPEIQVTKVVIKDGSILGQFKSPFPEDLNVKLYSDDIFKDGKRWELNLPVAYTGTLPVTYNVFPSSLAGFIIQSKDDSIRLKYDARKMNGERVKLVDVFAVILNLSFKYVEGDWGTNQYDLPRDTIDISVYAQNLSGNLDFENPRILLKGTNSFGFPSRSKVATMNIRGVNGRVLNFTGPFVTDGFDFNYPSLNEIGQKKETTYEFNRSNSNIREVFREKPIFLDYDIDGVANPDPSQKLIGFMTDSSEFSIEMTVELPLKGKASGFTAKDTIEVQGLDFGEISSGQLKVLTENSIPLTMKLKLSLMDSGKNLIGDLPGGEQIWLKGASVNGNGDSTGPISSSTFIELDEKTIALLKQAKYILVNAEFETSVGGNVPVQLNANQSVIFKIGLIAETK